MSPLVVDLGGPDVRMAEKFLHVLNVGAVVQRRGRTGRPRRMRGELRRQPGELAALLKNPCEVVFVQRLALVPAVFDRQKEGGCALIAMARTRQIDLDRMFQGRMDLYGVLLATFFGKAQHGKPLFLVEIANGERAKLGDPTGGEEQCMRHRRRLRDPATPTCAGLGRWPSPALRLSRPTDGSRRCGASSLFLRPGDRGTG